MCGVSDDGGEGRGRMIVALFPDNNIIDFRTKVEFGRRVVQFELCDDTVLSLLEVGDVVLVERVTKRGSIFVKVQIHCGFVCSNSGIARFVGIEVGFVKKQFLGEKGEGIKW